MIRTGFESRVKIQDVISNQLPEFILDESPKTLDFLKQYYISQEYQGGTVDIAENLDQYLKLDNLKPEIIVDNVTLESSIGEDDDTITVSSTKGFPTKYGLLKIDNEIITYTGITTNSFIGCIRGFSGITDYHDDLNIEELVFDQTSKSSHSEDSKVTNLSSLFLKEFFKKFKFTFAPGFEGRKFDDRIDVGNFIKEIKSLYSSKGTDESFRILFNVLFGENPSIINLEDYLLKSSDSNYVRSDVAILEPISDGNPVNIKGQSLYKNNNSFVSAAISSISPFTRGQKLYYKVSLFVGSNDGLTAKETFDITPNTKLLEDVNVGDSVISVDSTIGFSESGTIYSGSNTITYTNKSINQFFGCSGVESKISSADNIYSDDTYFSFENGDVSKRIDFRLTGIISEFNQGSDDITISKNQKVSVQSIGDNVKNPENNKSYKQIFANSWIYNACPSVDIESITGSIVNLKNSVDRCQLKKNDLVEIVDRSTNIVVYPTSTTDTPFVGQDISIGSKQIFLSGFSFTGNGLYKLRRKVNKAYSNTIGFLNGNSSEITDIQNVYFEDNKFAYVASNSLPSSRITGITTEFLYNLTPKLSEQNISPNSGFITDKDLDTNAFTTISFEDNVEFITGDRIVYEFSDKRLFNLDNNEYYVKVIDQNSIKLFESVSTLDDDKFAVKFYSDKYPESTENEISGSHTFRLFSQSNKELSGSKILRKFSIPSNIKSGKSTDTIPNFSVGMLINGVEISNYKSEDKVYYGPLEKIRVLNGGKDYDVINLPKLKVQGGSEEALAIPVITGTITDINVTPQEFDIEQITSISIEGGNSKGGILQPILAKRRREVLFDARKTTQGGGISTSTNQLSFSEDHNFFNGQEVVYFNNGNNNVSIGLGSSTLTNNSSYFVSVDNNTTIKLYNTFEESINGTNPIGFGGTIFTGIQKFKTADFKDTLTEIRVIDGGTFTNRQLYVKTSGISTAKNAINFEDHGFSTGEVVDYFIDSGETPISGLSTANSYYIIANNKDSFQLCDAGVGNTISSNFERRNIVKLSSTGSGYQKFKYPDIKITVNLSPVGSAVETAKSIQVSPTIKGSIEQIYVYNKGLGFGSKTLNFERNPKIFLQNGREASIKPNIISGSLLSVSIEFGGFEYFSEPDLELFDSTGKGSGAKLKANISEGKISSVVVINRGSNYPDNSKIIIRPRGLNAVYEGKIRSLIVNSTQKRSGLYYDLKNKNQGLQFTFNGYLDKLRDSFGEEPSTSSGIIGWAYDGNPIYGCFGISDPTDINSITKTLISGYTLDTSKVIDRPSGFPDGFFVEDYCFDNSGDLDEHNGRFEKTNEFPNGVYAYHASINSFTEKPEFPYFIGNSFKSNLLTENNFLDQTFEFTKSNLIRNTFPFKITERFSGYDFVTESREISNQDVRISSISKGNIDKIDIVNPGQNYKIGDKLKFENQSFGGGVQSEVSSIKGKEISNITTSSEIFENAVFVWNSNKIRVHTPSPNTFKNGDYVNVSGFTTSKLSQLNGFSLISVEEIPNVAISTEITASGISTDIYVTDIPNNVSSGSSIHIGNETLSILNVYSEKNILRVKRDSSNVGIVHTVGTAVTFNNYIFDIEKSIPYFDSNKNVKVYFNPKESVGLGTISGRSTGIQFNLGEELIKLSVPAQSIFLKDHPFKNNQKVNFDTGGNNDIQVKSTPTGINFNLPSDLYIANKSRDTIGFKTSPTSTEVYFIVDGQNSADYLIESVFDERTAKIAKNKSTVSVSTYHGLKSGDVIDLNINPSLSVGIGTSSKVKVLYNDYTENIIIDPVKINTSDINTSLNEITISNHSFKTGDKVIYTNSSYISPNVPVNNTSYYVFVKDINTIKLCETIIDTRINPPKEIDITSTGNSNQKISLINPQIKVVKNNNLVFDLSDNTLSGYKFKVFYDKEFLNDFVSTGSTDTFVTVESGTPGDLEAEFTINYNSNLPQKIYYSLEKSGYISTSDTTIENYSEILYFDSFYNQRYSVFGIESSESSSFDINLRNVPEKLSYDRSECDKLEYTTTSKNAKGPVNKVKIISRGLNYSKLPIFSGTDSEEGSGLSILSKSSSIGNVLSSKVIDTNYEYSSDKTLKPIASIAPTFSLIGSNIVGFVSVTDGGSNFINAPDLVLINKDDRKEISNGLLRAVISGSSISRIVTEVPPKGISDFGAEVFTVNNTNGVSVQKVSYDVNSQTFDCTITTPFGGFGKKPFAINDEVFIEGIQKEGLLGDGFNSKDYGYKFFTVTNYGLAADPSGADIVTIKSKSSNPGTPKSIQDSSGTLVNTKNYPVFLVEIESSNFQIGEDILLNGEESNLEVFEYESSNIIKIFGSDAIKFNDKITGKVSGNVATINDIDLFDGSYTVSATNRVDEGWFTRSGFLNEDYQVLPDNDYYQNLSYAIKSQVTWNDQKTAINDIVHTIGTKNFAHTELTKESDVGITTSSNVTTIVVDILNEKRVDTINNFDLVQDADVFGKKSRFLKLKAKKLSDFNEAISNNVLKIDDISEDFSDSEFDPELFVSIDDEKVSDSSIYQNFLIKVVSEESKNQIQFTDMTILSDPGNNNFAILEKETLTNSGLGTSHTGNEQYGDFSIETDLFGDTFIRFTPTDPFNVDYDIKFIKKSFTNDIGISTESIGFVDLISFSNVVSTGSTMNIVGFDTSSLSSIFVTANIIDGSNNISNLVELYVTHDGENTSIAEYFVDSDSDFNSDSFLGIGSFVADINSGQFTLDFENNSPNNLIIKSRIVGFGSTGRGEGNYRYLAENQPATTERTAIYRSDIEETNAGSAKTVLSLNKFNFDAVKSFIEVGIGSIKTLHQVLLLQDQNNIFIQQSPYITDDNYTTGIGTFGGSYLGSTNFDLVFYPDGNQDISINAFSQCFYTEVDFINQPKPLSYGSALDEHKVAAYNSINGDRFNTKSFTLTKDGVPILARTFNPVNTNQLDASTGKFTLTGNYFNENEELIYTAKSTFAGISAVDMTYKNGASEGSLPSSVFVINKNEDDDTFQISTTRAGTAVTFTDLGSGNDHQFEMFKSNEKVLITLSDLVQYPLVTTLITKTLEGNGGSVSAASSFISLSGISTINPLDLLKVDNEYMLVNNVGFGTTNVGPISGLGDINLVNVQRGTVGSSSTIHSDSSSVKVFQGTFNILDGKINFTEPPRGNAILTRNKSNLEYESAEFSGRVFLRKDYSTNKIYDNLGPTFTGIGRTYTLTVGGQNTTGIGTSGGNGFVILNGIYQSPITDNNPVGNYNILEDSVAGITSISFTGIRSDLGDPNSVFISEIDVNQNQLPRGGIIVSLGSSGGLGIAPLDGAKVFPRLNGLGEITSIVGVSTYGSSLGIQTTSYNEETGILEVTTSTIHNLNSSNQQIWLENLEFSCDNSYAGITTTIFPDGTLGNIFNIVGIVSERSFNLDIGISTIPHSYVGSGNAYPYFNGLSFGSGYREPVSVIVTDPVYTHDFYSADTDSITVISGVGGPFTPEDSNYDGATGLLTLVIKNHGLQVGNTIRIADNSINFTCSKDDYTSIHSYPRSTDPAFGTTISIAATTTNTFTVGVGSAVGSGATITATVGAGGTLSFNIVDGGSKYVNPQVFVSEPSYENLSVTGVSRVGLGTTTDTGVGFKVSVDVGASSTTGIGSTYFEVKNFKIVNNGYAFKKGDVFTPVGLVTDSRLSSPITQFQLTVLNTYSDNFAVFQYGEFDYIDSVKNYQDGNRRRFPLFYQGDLISFESGNDDIPETDLKNLLLIIVNGIIQDPGTAYTFEGGTSFLFTEAPKVEDNIDIFFYRGTKGSDDNLVTDIIPSIEVGDTIQVKKNNSIPKTITQDERVVFDLSRSDTFETNPYADQGINEIDLKPLSWTKQKTDRVVNGQQVFKTRRSILSQIYPVTKIIKDVSTSDTDIFVDNVDFFGSDDIDGAPYQFKGLIAENNNFESADITTIIGTGGTISEITITNPGSGYLPSSTIDIKFMNPLTVGTGIGTTASATGNISVGGTLSSVTITNPGFGYTVAPRAIVETIDPIIEKTGIIQNIKGFNGNIIGIGTTTSSGQLALKFNIERDKDENNNSVNIENLTTGNAILVYNTNVGSGVTTVDGDDNSIIGIGTSFLDNIYYINEITTSGPTGIITCTVDSGSNIAGIATTGGYLGRFSWGRLENVVRSSSPISIGVTGKTVDVGLTAFPSVIRRGVGLRQTGAI